MLSVVDLHPSITGQNMGSVGGQINEKRIIYCHVPDTVLISVGNYNLKNNRWEVLVLCTKGGVIVKLLLAAFALLSR